MQPAKEIIAWACSVFESLLSGFHLWLKSLHCTSL